MLRHVQLQGGSARTIEQVLRTKKPQKKMNKKVYISGAIAHYDLEERKAAFGNAERFLNLQK